METLIDKSIELGHETVAITEHDTIASAIRAEEYYDKIKEANPNFKMIRGNEIYLVRNGLNSQNFNKEVDRYFHFILLAKDAIGHQQIREISTRAWMRSYTSRKMRRVPTYYQDLIDIIGRAPGHVIGSTACLGGTLATQLLRNKENGVPSIDKIVYWVKQIQNIFGKDNFFLEMQPSFNEEQIYVNEKIVELSEELEVPFIITNDAHYLTLKERPIHKAFLNSQNGDREVDDFYATTFLMTDEQIREYMESYLGEENLQKAYQNILKIKNSCEDYSLKKDLYIPRLNWKNSQITNHDIEFYKDKIPLSKNFFNSKYKEDKRLVEIICDKVNKTPELQNEETYN